jgi:hypothetical protein
LNLQSSTVKNDETGEAFDLQQAAQSRAYRAAWKRPATRAPQVSVSRSILALIDDRDRAISEADAKMRTRSVSSLSAPDVLIEQLRKDEGALSKKEGARNGGVSPGLVNAGPAYRDIIDALWSLREFLSEHLHAAA